MLVLTRRKLEEIVIGENITIRVLEIREGRVRIGIDAPRNISIKRSELLDAKDDTKDK